MLREIHAGREKLLGNHEVNLDMADYVDSECRLPVDVSLVPAHPSYGVISMLRYWRALLDSHRASDRYQFHSVLMGDYGSEQIQRRSRFHRIWTRHLAYPLQVRTHCRGKIAHVLDHSWADMLSHVPARMAKVVNVHDLIPLRYPGELREGQVKRFRQIVDHVQKADRAICISEYTKREAMEWLGIPEEKLRVVYLGVEPFILDEGIHAEIEARLACTEGLLRLGCIGSTLERKNLAILAPALARAKALGVDVALIRVGAKLPEAQVEALHQAIGSDRLIEMGILRDDQLAAFYRAVDGVVMPSTYEGFGLPVLEAMAAGTPVLSSSSSCLPEVGGDAALYFDPHMPDELAQRLVEWAEPERRRELGSLGQSRAAHFSWRSTLEGVYDVYRELA